MKVFAAHIMVFLLIALASAGPVFAVDAASAPNSAILPRPKSLKWGEGVFPLSGITVATSSTKGTAAANEEKWLVERLKRELDIDPSAAPGSASSPMIKLNIVKNLEGVPEGPGRDETYVLRVQPQSAEISAYTDRGLFYGVESLFDLIRRDGDGWAIPACDVRDWPDFATRGLLIAPGQGFMPMDALQYRVDQAAADKLNLIHLHLTDEVLFTPRLACYPALAGSAADSNQSYTADELRGLVAYAKARKVELVPEISIPGHASRILQALPELQCKPTKGDPSGWALCIGADETYTFIERVVAELGPVFPWPWFHIGTDEVEFLDIPDCPVRMSWRECAVCQERIRKEGLKDERALFYYFIRRANDIVKSHGKRLMMWNDQIDIGKPAEVTVPRDVLIHFWRIAAPGRGPVENCDYSGFLKKGYHVVNSYYPETYIDFHITEKNLLKWNPWSSPEAPEPYRAQVLGGMMCAWSSHDLYRRVLPSAIPLFADRVWNRTPIDDPRTFARLLPRHIFGPSAPAELDGLFDALGCIVLPMALEPDKMARPETSLPGMDPAKKVEEYRRLMAVIDQEIAANRVRFIPALQAYRESLQWLVDKAGKN